MISQLIRGREMRWEAVIPESDLGRRRAAARTGASAGYAVRRQELIRVASELFREKGYDATTLNDVAERLNTDRASLYYYIRNKDELLRDVVVGVTTDNVIIAEELLAETVSCVEKVSTLVYRMLASYEQSYPQVFVFLQEDTTHIARIQAPWAQTMVKQTKRLEDILHQILQDGMDAGELRSDISVFLAAQALWGMVNSTHRWYRPGGRYSAQDVAESVASIFIEGMAIRPLR